MAQIGTQINPKDSSFLENKKKMLESINMLESYLEESKSHGTEKSVKRARSRKKMLARERIEYLLDKDSPFLELLPLSGLKNDSGFGPGGTNITGIGLVSNKLCMIQSNVGTKKGGSVDYATSYKSLRIGEIIEKNKLPTINLVESGGVNLPDQDKIFINAGKNFKQITQRSKLGLSTISLVFGNATAGGAYVPGMSDYTILQKNAAKVFLAGPPLVKMATNEISSDEELGGAEMHSKISGVSDYIAENEIDGIRIVREIVEYLDSGKPHLIPDDNFISPKFSADELLGIIPFNPKTPFDIRELIARIIDNSDFSEFKKEYGKTMVTGWAKIHGYPLAIIANNGVMFSESANKATQFIQLSNKNNVPILFINNTTGFMVGKKYEEGGIIKSGAKLINAVSNSEVPHLTLMVGSSYGAGNYGMNGRSYDPRFLFTYPNAKSGVMGSEQLAGVMEIIKVQSAKSYGKKINIKELEKEKEELIKKMSEKETAWFSTSEMWDDGIIDPRQTRNYIGFSLAVVYNQPIKGTLNYGVFRM